MGRPKLTEIIGDRYSYVVVIGRSSTESRQYECMCDCGKIFSTTRQRLKVGSTKSCGCMKSKLLSIASTKHGGYKDGKNSPEYQSYVAMIHRCYNPDRKNYDKYGGVGILVEQEEWLEPSPSGFLNFIKDMGPRPATFTLDRINGLKGYSKDNCRWASRRTQSVNTNLKKTSKNTSKYRGVSMRKVTGKWMARIGNGKGGYEWLGEFSTEDAAALAYNTRARELHGEDAKLNDLE